MTVKLAIFTAVRRMNHPTMTDRQVLELLSRVVKHPHQIVSAVGWTYLSQQLNELLGPMFERKDFSNVCDYGWEYDKKTKLLKTLFESCLNTAKTPINVEDFL